MKCYTQLSLRKAQDLQICRAKASTPKIMNALNCRTLATKMLLKVLTHTPQHKQTGPAMKSIIMCGCCFLVSSDSYLVTTYEFTDETPQIGE